MDERRGAGRVLWAEMMAVPAPDTAEDANGGERNGPEPQNGGLAVRQDDPGRKQRANGGADIAADLKQALRHAVAPARGNPGNARGFRDGKSPSQCRWPPAATRMTG